MKTKTKYVGLKIESQLLKDAKKAARAQKVSLSAYIRLMIQAGVYQR